MDMRLGGERRRILLVRKRQSDSYRLSNEYIDTEGKRKKEKGPSGA